MKLDNLSKFRKLETMYKEEEGLWRVKDMGTVKARKRKGARWTDLVKKRMKLRRKIEELFPVAVLPEEDPVIKPRVDYSSYFQ